jgi:L-amino acid N-acyltransferase
VVGAASRNWHAGPVGIQVRLARPEDDEAIRAIYNLEVTTSTVTFDIMPRSVEEQRAWSAARSGALVCLVAEDDAGEVVGFASLSHYRERPAYATTVEDSVYVDRAAQGLGVGRSLLEALVETARAHGFHSVVARIVDGHEASIALHRACGFEAVGIEKEIGRKFGRWLDVALMQKML